MSVWAMQTTSIIMYVDMGLESYLVTWNLAISHYASVPEVIHSLLKQ